METMNLTMEIFLDEETGLWGYAVPALSLVGTGCRTKEEAGRLGHESIGKVLEAGEQRLSPDAHIVRFRVETGTAE